MELRELGVGLGGVVVGRRGYLLVLLLVRVDLHPLRTVLPLLLLVRLL